jgi:stage IV sporulation protein FB
LHVATVFGIPIRIHLTFFLLLGWVGWAARDSVVDARRFMIFLLAVFGCVALHELGHALMARSQGVGTREIVLYPIGGVAKLEQLPSGRVEVLIAAAGPAVNLVLAALLMLAFGVVEQLVPGGGRGTSVLGGGNLLFDLALANLILFGFNLIPAFPMDGGRILRAALSMSLPIERATDIAAGIGQGIAVLLGLAGLVVFWQSPFLLLIALIVFLGAGQEAAFQRQRAAIRGRCARDAMSTRLTPIAPQHSLRAAADLMNATGQRVLAVVDAWQRVVGVLPRSTLMRALAAQGGDAAVLEVMLRDFETVPPDESLERVLARLRRHPGTPLVVTEDDRLAGLVTLTGLAEFIDPERSAAGKRGGDDRKA